MIIRNCIPRSFYRVVTSPAHSSPRQLLATFSTATQDATFNLDIDAQGKGSSPEPPVPQKLVATPISAHQRKGDDSRPVDVRVLSHVTTQHLDRTTGHYGTKLTPYYQPQTLLSNPPFPKDVTLELLLAAQSHLGHATSLWNPTNSRYIFGIRSGIHIISLDVTAQHLRRAAKVVSGVTQRGGLVLFVGTRPGFDTCVIRAAELARPACHLFERWTPGGITNAQQILSKCRVKVVDEFDRDVDGFDDMMLDRGALTPDLVVCLNPLENRVLLHECALAGIPTVGIIDTDANPAWVTYPIPANDDSLRCVQVIAGVLGRAGQEGQQERKKAAAKGSFTYNRDHSLTLPEGFDFGKHLAANTDATH